MMASLREALGLIIVLLCTAACSPPRRPGAVPTDAVYVEYAKVGCWQKCKRAGQGPVNCTIWNQAGLVLQDQTFLPVDDGPLPTETDLRLRNSGSCTGVYQVCLANGRILVPESLFDRMREHLR